MNTAKRKFNKIPIEKEKQLKAFLKENLGEPLRIAANKFGLDISTVGRYWDIAYKELFKTAA